MNTNDIVVSLPASKSLSNRWIVLNYLLDNAFQLRNLSDSDDTQLLRRLLAQLHKNGASSSKGTKTPTILYCDNAGTVARFLMSLVCVEKGVFLLTGSERLRQRPMKGLIEALRSMGFLLVCEGQEGTLPVRIEGGTPRRKMAFVDASQSSQFVSSLLLLGVALPDGISVSMNSRPVSRPYIEMTCDVLRQAGMTVTRSVNGRIYQVERLEKHPVMRAVTIESDWSSASYFYSIAALSPGHRIRMKGLSLQSSQGDCIVAEIFEKLGVTTREVKSPYRTGIHSVTVDGVRPADKILKYSFVDCPDLLPTVAVVCAALGVKAQLTGVKNLRGKESNRLKAIETELNKMGGKVTVTANEMRIASSELTPVQPVETYDDHRIAMAFAPLLLRFPNMKIVNPEIVSKSFPDFWNQLKIVMRKV